MSKIGEIKKPAYKFRYITDKSYNLTSITIYLSNLLLEEAYRWFRHVDPQVMNILDPQDRKQALVKSY